VSVCGLVPEMARVMQREWARLFVRQTSKAQECIFEPASSVWQRMITPMPNRTSLGVRVDEAKGGVPRRKYPNFIMIGEIKFVLPPNNRFPNSRDHVHTSLLGMMWTTRKRRHRGTLRRRWQAELHLAKPQKRSLQMEAPSPAKNRIALRKRFELT